MDQLIFDLPSDLAAELIKDQLVTEPYVWRGADVVSLLTLCADMTSAVTAVLVARESIASVVRRLVGHVGKSTADAADVTIFVQADGKVRILVGTNNPSGLERLEVQIESVVTGMIAPNDDN
jgi:hypothetical protein